MPGMGKFLCYTIVMIASLKGKIIAEKDKYVVVDVGGIGYKVYTLTENLLTLNRDKEIFFYIYTNVREDAFDLYGFLEEKEMEFFELLLSISGIGPKSALGILSIATIDTLKKAISQNDLAYLTKISGIGRKTAERIVIELRDKVGKMADDTNLSHEMDALEALKSLGYSQIQAREALKQIQDIKDTNSKVREALKILGKK